MMTMTGDTGVSGDCSYYLLSKAALAAVRDYLPSDDSTAGEDDELGESDMPVDVYSSDEFRMYDFKVRRCTRGQPHDWTECPYAHPGEKARRRDPRRFHYSGVPCPEFRKVACCERGYACEFAHGVFECWLHPARYRTLPCKDGTACRRRVCFFAHTREQLRLLPKSPSANAVESYDGSPSRQPAALESYIASKSHLLMSTSPTSLLLSPPSDSPSVSPNALGWRRSSWPVAAGSSVNNLLSPLRGLQLSKSTSSSWAASLQLGWWDTAVERVESGRAAREKIFERLSKESMVEKDEAGPAVPPAADLGWLSELVK